MKLTKNKYRVQLISDKTLTITGRGDASCWDNAEVLNQFVSPWSSDKADEINFKALWDGTYLFFCFKVFDKSVYINTFDDTFTSIGESDRVEIFFRKDDTLSPYYCLEIDPSARIMDFKAFPDKQFDFDWDWPKEDLIVKSSIADDSFTVEGAISIKSLKRLDLISDDGVIEAGIFRAKYNKKDENSGYEPTWITWINPNTELPNFHISDSFGELQLLQVNHKESENTIVTSTETNCVAQEMGK